MLKLQHVVDLGKDRRRQMMEIHLEILENLGYGINGNQKTLNGHFVIWSQHLLKALKDFVILKT